MKESIIITRPATDLAQLAGAIKAEHDHIVQGLRTSIEHARRMGVLLNEAKELCGHGQWRAWLKKNCTEIGHRQAEKYMRLARELPPKANRSSLLGGINSVLAQLSAPEETESDPADDGVASDPDDNPYQRDNQPAKRPATIAEQTPREPTTIPLASPAVRNEGGVKDARGRIVPDDLAADFEEGKKFVSDVRGTLSEVLEAFQAASAKRWGKALFETLQAVEIDLKNAKEAARCGVPSVVCPHVGDDGEHDVDGKCKVCLGNRGWLTRGNFEQLTKELKAACDDRAGNDAEREAA